MGIVSGCMSLLLVASLTTQSVCAGLFNPVNPITLDSITDKAKEVKEQAVESAEAAMDSMASWISNLNVGRFKDGCEYALEYMEIRSSALMTSEYMKSVEQAITNLKENMNSAAGTMRNSAQEAGYVAEKWTAGTFNIDAAANNSPYSAEVVASNDFGSVDVATNYGEDASLKFYQSATGSANAQAKAFLKAYKEYAAKSNNPMSMEDYLNSKNIDTSMKEELYKSVYEGQTRIIPADQLTEAVEYLNGKIGKLESIEGEATSLQANTYRETVEKLKDRLVAPDGTQSRPLTSEEAQAIAELSQNGQFKPEDFGIKVSQVINYKQVFQQALGTGIGVGLLKTVFEIGPDIYSILVEAAKTGNLDETQLKEVGVEGTIAMSEGFVEGSVSSVVATLCASGALGETLKKASPSIIATLTFLAMEAVIGGYELSQGKITAEEYSNMMMDRIMVSMLMIPTSAAIVALLPASKLVVLAGCLAGGMVVCTGYSIGKEAVLNIIDGGGIEAIVPKGVTDSVSVAKNTVKNMNMSDITSFFGDYVVSKLSDGCIKIKGCIAG